MKIEALLHIIKQFQFRNESAVIKIKRYPWTKMNSRFSIIFTQPLRSGRIWHKVNFFKRSVTGLNSEFSFSYTSCLTKAEEPRMPYYLPIARGRIIVFIRFPRVLLLCEMQSVSSWIWTRIAVSISCDDNHYTTGTSIYYRNSSDYHKAKTVGEV